jgi:acetyl-CoA carboxylase biotin carboxyl carrier protein
MTIKNEEIRSLLTFFEKSGWQEMRLEVGEVKIAVSKNGSLSSVASASPQAVASVASPPVATPQAAPSALAAPAAANPALAAGQAYVRAPSLGVVWGQSKPGAPPFVEVGQQIDVGTTVCLLEVMKLFTQVTSNVKGKIVRRLVADGEMVEHDTPLFIVELA